MAFETSLTSLLNRLTGRSGLSRVWGADEQANEFDLTSLCHSLLGARGEASGTAMADRILLLYETKSPQERQDFFSALRDQFEVNLDEIQLAVDAARDGFPQAYRALQKAAEPPRQELLRRLNSAPNGTARLVAIREDLLRALDQDPSLEPVDADFRHLLRSWFNRGFLIVSDINWSTSAEILEKIIAYEAVHAIDSWDALRLRLVPRDRRCFAFFHPAMPDEPLIFVEVALTRGIASSIQTVLDDERDAIAPEDANTAIFYSISNCQAGLAGVSFGSFLIKQVAADLMRDLPNLKQFATLSPIPGLGRWMNQQAISAADGIDEKGALQPEVARYLLLAKDAKGRPMDPVARFHLGNGAQLHAIHAGADTSENGVQQSRGYMVNYLYELDKIERRHEAFVAGDQLAASKEVMRLLPHPNEPDHAPLASPSNA